jgi:hypothetical protein
MLQSFASWKSAMKTATTPKLKPPAPGFKQIGTSLSGPRQASKSQATRALFRVVTRLRQIKGQCERLAQEEAELEVKVKDPRGEATSLLLRGWRS